MPLSSGYRERRFDAKPVSLPADEVRAAEGTDPTSCCPLGNKPSLTNSPPVGYTRVGRLVSDSRLSDSGYVASSGRLRTLHQTRGDSRTGLACYANAASAMYSTNLFVLLSHTGLRRGEALALRWPDVDLEAGTLRVRGTLSRALRVG